MLTDTQAADAKAAARTAFERVESELVELSHRIHAHPEIKWEEERACGLGRRALTGYGFAVESGICDLPTAFQAPGRVGAAPRRDLRRVRRACPASATPAATTSSPPPPSAPAWRWPRWPTTSA